MARIRLQPAGLRASYLQPWRKSLKFPAIAILAVLMIPFTPRGVMAESPCADQSTTIDTVECTGAKTKIWDQRLNVAYKALGKVIDPAQRDPLKVTQRIWIQYRVANCSFYAAHDGTLGQVIAAECFRSMTQERALELEQAAKQ
jgi:uncharacterized protein YecT (DUF1311 family)